MRTKDLEELRRRQTAFLERVRENGGLILSFFCPLCDAEQQAVAPATVDEDWDSCTTCTACGELYFKVVTRDGVSVRPLQPPEEA